MFFAKRCVLPRRIGGEVPELEALKTSVEDMSNTQRFYRTESRRC